MKEIIFKNIKDGSLESFNDFDKIVVHKGGKDISVEYPSDVIMDYAFGYAYTVYLKNGGTKSLSKEWMANHASD